VTGLSITKTFVMADTVFVSTNCSPVKLNRRCTNVYSMHFISSITGSFHKARSKSLFGNITLSEKTNDSPLRYETNAFMLDINR